MFCYFSVVITFLIASVFARYIPYNTAEHNNRSICEGKILTVTCDKACKAQNTEPLCTIEHLCVCTYPPGLRTDIVDENRIAVIIDLQKINPSDESLNADNKATPPDEITHQSSGSFQYGHQGQHEYNSTLQRTLRDIVSPKKINLNFTPDGYYTTSEGFPPLNADWKNNADIEETALVKVEPQPEHVRGGYNHKAVWTEQGFKGSENVDKIGINYEIHGGEEGIPNDSDLKASYTEVDSQVAATNPLKINEKDDIENQKHEVTSENELPSTINNISQDEDTVMSAKPFYEKYLTLESNVRSLLTNQTFAMSFVLLYFAVGMLFYFTYSYKKKYVSVPLNDY